MILIAAVLPSVKTSQKAGYSRHPSLFYFSVDPFQLSLKTQPNLFRKNSTEDMAKIVITAAVTNRLDHNWRLISMVPLESKYRAENATQVDLSTQGPTLKSPGENNPRREYIQLPKRGKKIVANNAIDVFLANPIIDAETTKAIQKKVASAYISFDDHAHPCNETENKPLTKIAHSNRLFIERNFIAPTLELYFVHPPTNLASHRYKLYPSQDLISDDAQP